MKYFVKHEHELFLFTALLLPLQPSTFLPKCPSALLPTSCGSGCLLEQQGAGRRVQAGGHELQHCCNPAANAAWLLIQPPAATGTASFIRSPQQRVLA